LSSEVALEEPEIGSTDPNITIDINCMDNEQCLAMPGRSGDYEDEVEECDEHAAIRTARQARWRTTDRERFDLGTCDVDGYQGKDSDDADVDAGEEVSQGDDGLTQNVDD
jgi:hypothetical protein